MTVETSNTIQGLSEGNPTGQEFRTEGDDHLRLIKNVLKKTFPSTTGTGLDGSVNADNDDLSATVGAGAKYRAGSSLQDQINDLNNGIYSIPSEQFIGFGGDGSPANQSFAIGFTENAANQGYKALLLTSGVEDEEFNGGLAIYDQNSGVSERIVLGFQPKCFINMVGGTATEDLVNRGYINSTVLLSEQKLTIEKNRAEAKEGILQNIINSLILRVEALENP